MVCWIFMFIQVKKEAIKYVSCVFILKIREKFSVPRHKKKIFEKLFYTRNLVIAIGSFWRKLNKFYFCVFMSFLLTYFHNLFKWRLLTFFALFLKASNFFKVGESFSSFQRNFRTFSEAIQLSLTLFELFKILWYLL